ncbi:glycosyltransferase [Nesterenkonia populi]|uniref:glycosyltransferase n=1 Tax=Nesterenkonia populi TaxID=1591087 RepID=UPI0011BEF6A4|nr:glycosyltransferase [Nesterenkonia populi]
MTLRNYADHYGVEVDPKIRSEDVTIAFAFDAGYLPLFQVAAYSLAQSKNFLDSEVVIYTDDPVVADDPMVKITADRISMLEGERRERLYGLAENSIHREDRAQWNKGTFLKWMMFEEQNNPTAVFLDVDMIFLRSFDEKLLQAATADFNAAPQFMYRLLKDEAGEHLPLSRKWEVMNAALAADYSGRLATNVNSGLMVIREPMLSRAFFDEITAFASQSRRTNEQSHFTAYFKKHPERLKMISYAFNHQDEYIGALRDWEAMKELMEKISVIHYAGKPKPWHRRLSDVPRPTSSLWHWHATASGADVRPLMGVPAVS